MIQTLQMTTTLSGANNLTLINNISLSNIFMSLPGIAGESSDDGIVNMTSFISSGFHSPFPISLEVLIIY